MKNIILFLLLSVSFTSLAQVSMYKSTVVLNDGDSCVFEIVPAICIQNYEKEERLEKKWINIIQNTPVLKALGISQFDSIIKGAKWIIGGYQDPYGICFEIADRLYQTKKFNKFLHQAVSTPKLRKILFPIVSKIACDVCSIYPKDFKNRVLRELKDAKAIVADMPNHKYEIVVTNNKWSTVAYSCVLYIDGEEFGIWGGVDKEHIEYSYLKAFLYRRILIDGFTIEELSGYINTLIADISRVDVSKNGDYLYCKEFNNTLQFRYTVNSSYLYAIRQRGKIFESYAYDEKRIILKCEGWGENIVYNISSEYPSFNKWFRSYNWIVNSDGEVVFEQKL